MKVLMLGWEFPPHISGGLGTACAGLTQALGKEHVNILFVIPKMHGGESSDSTNFINASAIPIRQKAIIAEEENASLPKLHPENSRLTVRDIQAETQGSHSVIEVPAFLTPYTTPSGPSGAGLHQWNYSIEYHATDRTVPANLPSKPANSNRTRMRYVKEPFAFTGDYGRNLFTEVDRYSHVASEIARRHTFDLIHAHDWMTYKAAIAAKKASGKPLVVHVHATEIDRSGEHVNQEIFEIEKQGMMMADKVVTVSQWTKDIAIRYYHIPAEKIEVVHNGITPRSLPEEPVLTPPLDAPIVTFLGRITYQKGPLYFVEAARKVHERFPDVHFVVAGSGDQLPIMIERIAQLRLSSHFHFTGFLRGGSVDRVWAMSTVYVMPSVSEPFGIAPLEAIQAGVPTIVSKQAGVSEVLPHAIKVDFWNTEAFADAICNVLRFKSLANTLRKNGAEQIRTITWEKAAKKLITIYDELINKHEKRAEPGSVLPGTPAKKVARTAVL